MIASVNTAITTDIPIIRRTLTPKKYADATAAGINAKITSNITLDTEFLPQICGEGETVNLSVKTILLKNYRNNGDGSIDGTDLPNKTSRWQVLIFESAVLRLYCF